MAVSLARSKRRLLLAASVCSIPEQRPPKACCFGKCEMSQLEILTVDNRSTTEYSGADRGKCNKSPKAGTAGRADAGDDARGQRRRAGRSTGRRAPALICGRIAEDEENDQPRQTFILFNPEIVKRGGEQIGYEGCLSIPGYVGEVARNERITVKGLNEKGQPVRHKAEGYLARVFQHEIDHLDGILYIDRLTNPDTFRPVEAGQEEVAEMEAAEMEAAMV